MPYLARSWYISCWSTLDAWLYWFEYFSGSDNFLSVTFCSSIMFGVRGGDSEIRLWLDHHSQPYNLISPIPIIVPPHKLSSAHDRPLDMICPCSILSNLLLPYVVPNSVGLMPICYWHKVKFSSLKRKKIFYKFFSKSFLIVEKIL